MPRYQKAFEAAFFAIFLGLYYAVLIERNSQHITVVEVLLYIWIFAFGLDEFGEFRDAGSLFYATDFWSLWDVGIIGVGIAYLVLRKSIVSIFCLPGEHDFDTPLIYILRYRLLARLRASPACGILTSRRSENFQQEG